MKRILKFTLGPGPNEIVLDRLDRVLHVGWQNDGRFDELRIWVEGEPGDARTVRLYVAGTGHQPPRDASFLGTAVGSQWVAHVYGFEP